MCLVIINKKFQSNLGRPASPSFTAENNYATNSLFVTIICPTFTPEIVLPSTISIHPSTDPNHHPNGIHKSNQPLCHSIHPPDRQTDRQTHRQMGLTASLYHCIAATRLTIQTSRNWELIYWPNVCSIRQR